MTRADHDERFRWPGPFEAAGILALAGAATLLAYSAVYMLGAVMLAAGVELR